jgi:hypothetical protein
MRDLSRHWSSGLPFYYGWLIVGVAFITMAVGVSARTAFSLLLPPLIDEFGWTAAWSPAPSPLAFSSRRC